MPEIGEEEKPFDLPKTWSWARLGELVDIVYGKGLPTSELTSEGYEVFGANGVIGCYSSYLYAEPQLLVSCRGAYSGKPNISPTYCFVTSNSLVLQSSWENLSLKFFFYSLSIAKKEKIVTGSAQPQVTTTNLDPFLVVVPPLSEQHRIVAKVDELMAICDRLEAHQADAESAHAQLVQALLNSLTQASDAADFTANWQRLAEHFHTLFTTEPSIDALKQTLLQLAVMGKLVPQAPSDEPASELLKRIAEEKARLMAGGQIKKQKKLLKDIGSADQKFELPPGWEAARLSDVVNILNGRAYKKEELLDVGTPVLRVGNLFTSNHWYYSNLTLEEDKYCNPGDLLFAWSASFGPFIWQGERSIYHYHIWKLDFYAQDQFSKNYLYNFLLEQTQEIKAAGHGVSMVHMTKEKMEKLVVPVPPLAEQHRIVAKVDQLMALCDQLKARLNQARQVHEQLASALVEQAVA